MSFFIKTDDIVVPDFQKEATMRFSGRDLKEIDCVRLLWSNGVLFSKRKGRARRSSPLSFLLQQERWKMENPKKRSSKIVEVPSTLQYVVLTDGVSLGNKLWGRVDYLVNHRRYKFVDERGK